jgi:transmembrane 9 superfamily protein 3
MYEDRGELMSSVIIGYSLSTFVAGYVSGSYYKQFFSTSRSEVSSKWQIVMLSTILLFPCIAVSILIVLNGIAIYYDTLGAIPVSVLIKMMFIWVFIAVPLSIVGTLVGRHMSTKYEVPCRVNSIPRPIPPCPWYLNPTFIIPVSGVLPFGSIFIEMYFMFTAIWSYKFYYVYGFMLLMFFILTIVTVNTTIVAVYFILNSENHHWQWISLGCAGSSATYVFCYSIFYFWYKTKMTGLLQVSHYFGYM